MFFRMDNAGCFVGTVGLETRHVVPEFSELVNKCFDYWLDSFTYILSDHYDSKKARDLAGQILVEIEGSAMLATIRQDESVFKASKKRILSMLP